VPISTIDTFVAGKVFPIFGVPISTVDTFVAGSYNISVTGVPISTIDTFVAGKYIHTTHGAFISSPDTFVAGTMTGVKINQKIFFPNIQGRHLSLVFSNADATGGCALYHARFKLAKSTDRSRFDTNKVPLPRFQGTHLSIKVSHSASEAFTAEYMSAYVDVFRE
jgi:hypothetical protein